MTPVNRRRAAWIAAIAVALIAAAVIVTRMRSGKKDTWYSDTEGFLAVATPCCTRASLWSSLEEETADGQSARPATAVEAAEWLNTWPYRSSEDDATFEEPTLILAGQSTEVRCTGAPTGDPVPRQGDDVESLQAIRARRECSFAKWKIWAGETAKERPHERHTVWVDEQDRFHGRVDYWR